MVQIIKYITSLLDHPQGEFDLQKDKFHVWKDEFDLQKYNL